MNHLDIMYWIIKASLIGSVMAVLIVFIKMLMRKKLTPTLHYYIWLLLIIKLIFPYGPQSKISLYNMVNPSNSYVKLDYSISKHDVQSKNDSSENNFKKIDKDTSSNNVTVNSVDRLSANVSEKKENILTYEDFFFFIWISGIALGAIYIILGRIKIKKIINSNLSHKYEAVLSVLDSCIYSLNVRQKIRIIVTDNVGSPSLSGLLQPTIILPKNIVEKLSEKDLKYIFLHELCHVKRKDIIFSWAAALLKLIYWFNPIIVFSLNRMQKDCEICCDSTVLSYLHEGENKYYGNTIINVLELVNKSFWIPGTTSIILKKSDLKRRIKMITSYGKISLNTIILGIVVVLIVAGVGLTGGIKKIDSNINSDNKQPIEIFNQENTTFTIQEQNSGIILSLDQENDSEKGFLTEKEITHLAKTLSLNTTKAIYINDNLITSKVKIEDDKEEGYILIDGKRIATKKTITIKAVGNTEDLLASCPEALGFGEIIKFYKFNIRTFENIEKDNSKKINVDYKALIESGNMVEIQKTAAYGGFIGTVYNSDRLEEFIKNFTNLKYDKMQITRYAAIKDKIWVSQLIDLEVFGSHVHLTYYDVHPATNSITAGETSEFDDITKLEIGGVARYAVHNTRNEANDMGAAIISFKPNNSYKN